MAPLGVRVVTVILGGVETNGNNPDLKGELELPQDSYYQKIWAIINRHYKALVFTKKAKLDESAKNVVNDVLGGRHYFIRYGEGSVLSWYCNKLLPYGLFVNMVNGNSGLAELGGK
jgi:1-acylglycerone phosphate reductase